MTLSLRTTLLLGYAIVVTLIGSFAIFTGLSFISDTVVNEAKLQVQMDLNAAWSAYNEEKALLQTAVSIVAQRRNIHSVLVDNHYLPQIDENLESLRKKYHLDFLILLDKSGRIIKTSEKSTSKDTYLHHAVVDQALQGRVVSGTNLLTREELLEFSQDLADRAHIPLIPTERARPTDQTVEDRGMVLEAAVPIIGPNNKIYGLVYGGILLNRRFDLVDKICKAVFDIDYYNGKPLGTVTIFLWDRRVSTNVIKADTTRAIGTCVSEEVYTKVLEKGERFGGRAFVVTDWYLSAYDPIRDLNGKIIGILYVGLLEQKYLDYKSDLTIKYLGAGLLAFLLAGGFSFFFAGRIRKPIERLMDVTRKISSGELSTRVEGKAGISDIQELGNSFNSMAESLEMRSIQLESASNELREAYKKLYEVYKKADEKNRAYLEMLGFVTHELKSPLASIVFALSSLRDKSLGPTNKAQEELLRSSAKSADYLNTTIANFLNLSRIEEGALIVKLEQLKPCEDLCKHITQRLSELIADNEMKVNCKIPEDLVITGDSNLLDSVFQNLITNAIKYGDNGSTITIDFSENPDDYIFSIYNEGIGFSKEDVEGLFTKFSRFSSDKYNTKSGTGLGLFVIKVIVDKHGGKIWAESEEGKWARFTFTIPKNIISGD